MDHKVELEWLRERKALTILTNERCRILLLDKFAGQKLTDAFKSAADRIKNEIRYLDPNLTDDIKHCDMFPIQNIKLNLYGMWNNKKINMNMSGKWSES